MMTVFRNSNLVLILAIAATSCGCKSTGSGFKMPGSGMFSSLSRTPDAATLAGSSAAGAKNEVPTAPTSPATKYTPGAIASVGAQSPTSTATAAAPTSSAYGYASTSSAATPKTGLAAQANGYQTGPYQTASTGGASPSTSLAGTTSSTTPSTTGLPSPYGGSYSRTAGATAPDITLPNSVNNALATAGGSAATTPVSYPSGTAGLPNYPSLPVGGTAATAPASSAYQPSTANANPYQGATTLTTGSGVGTASGTATAAGNRYGPASSYAPGTTGRSTTYNFGQPAASTSLPPNTAANPSPLLR